MTNKKARRIVALLVVLSTVSGYAAWRSGYLSGLPQLGRLGLFGSNDKPSPAGMTLYGNVDMREVQLAFRENYRIENIFVDEGTHVQKGQAIAKLDTRHLEQNIQRAEAVATMRRHVLADLVAGSRPEEIAEAQARVTAAVSVHERTRRDLERY